MRCRPLNQKEKSCIEKVLYPYGLGNFPLQGGSMSINEEDNIVYYLDIGRIDPLAVQTRKIGKNLKEILGADEIYIQAVKIV